MSMFAGDFIVGHVLLFVLSCVIRFAPILQNAID